MLHLMFNCYGHALKLAPFYDFRLTQIKRAREIGRIVVGSAITLGFVIGIPLMMEWGRRSKSSGDSIAKRRKEWIRKLQKQRKRERESEAAAASDNASDK